ncbi:hypothetical protein ACFCP7_09420 [Paenibacillus elgii]
MSDQKILYRFIGQSEEITLTVNLNKAMTQDEAIKVVEKDVFRNEIISDLKPYVVLPICSETQWKLGNINFCPRCGQNIVEYLNEDPDFVYDAQLFDCPECNASCDVTIKTHEAFDSDDEEECE